MQRFLCSVLLYGSPHAFLADQVLYTFDEELVLSALSSVVPKRSLVVLWSAQAYEQASGPLQQAAVPQSSLVTAGCITENAHHPCL